MSNIVKKTRIMNIPFANETLRTFMQKAVEPAVHKEEKTFIVTANPEIVMAAKKDSAYEEILLAADHVVPDGIGIVLAAKWKKEPLQERIAGVELMDRMLKLANQERLSCYFLGAKEEVNEAAVRNIQEKYPNLIVAGRHHGYFELGDEAVAQAVRDTEPDFIFAALGYPKQEQWITAHQRGFSKGIFMGVGGSFDVYAGHVKRAPAIWIKLHLEWMYRLLQQPSRLKRIGPLFAFVWRAIRRK